MNEDRVRRVPPPVRTNSIGVVSSQLDMLYTRYRERNPDRDARYTYAPEHKGTHSKYTQRVAQGYSPVLGKEVGLEGADAEKPVRVGDLMLMGMEAEKRAGMIRERVEYAKDELRRVEREYYDNVSQIETAGPDGKVHRTKAIGRADIEIVEKEYDFAQREEE